MLKASLNVIRFIKLTIKLVVLAVSLYLGHAAYTLYFHTDRFTAQYPEIYQNAGVYNELIGKPIGWRLPTVTANIENVSQEVLQLKHRSRGTEKIGVAAMWLFFIAMCWLFRKSVVVITLLFTASILGSGYYAYGWFELGWPNEKMQFPSMVIAGMFGLAVMLSFFGFHTLKFKLRRKSPIHAGQKRNINVIMPWLHYTPYWAHFLLLVYCVCMSIIAIEFEIIYNLLSGGVPTLIPTAIFFVAYTLYLLFRLNKITAENESLNYFQKSLLSEQVEAASASNNESQIEKVEAFCQVASHFNLDEIEIYESNHFDSVPEVVAPNFFARKAILRIKVPKADWSALQWKQYLSMAIIEYYASTDMVKSLMETCSHDYVRIDNWTDKILDSVKKDQKKLDDMVYLVETKDAFGRRESHLVKKNETTGLFRTLFSLLVLIPTLIIRLLEVIFLMILWMYKQFNRASLKEDRFVIQAKVG